MEDIAERCAQMADYREAIDGMIIAWPGEMEPESEGIWLKAMPRKGAVYLPVCNRTCPSYED